MPQVEFELTILRRSGDPLRFTPQKYLITHI
jgi:hypothetical protein